MESKTDQPSFIFTAPFEVQIKDVKGEERVFLDGFISTSDVDLVNDVVTKNCLESFKKQILQKNLKLDIEHEAFRGDSVEEKELNKTKIPAGKMLDAAVVTMGKGRYGLHVRSEVNPHRENYEQIKGNIKDEYLDAYSIAFIPTKTSIKNVQGKNIRFLDDAILLNVALTGNPINTEAKNREIFMKSIESLEDYKKEKKSNPEIMGQLEVKNNQAIDNKLNLQEVKNMSEEEKETVEAEKTEAPAKEETAPVESEAKDEAPSEEAEAPKEEEAKEAEPSEEVKALTEKLNALSNELAEVKASIAKPIRKSPVEQVDKSKNFVEEKSHNPLDIIA